MNMRNLAVFLCSILFWLPPASPSFGGVYSQCPCPPGTPVSPETGNIECTLPGPPAQDVACKHLAAGDGFVKMADGRDMYCFGFSDMTGVMDDMVMHDGMLNANFPGPVIDVREGQDFYLTLSNVGMAIRPDLFDPHTVHFHGLANAATVFDGEPMASISVNMGSSLTYYYRVAEPGTYMYHCHVEATEHMQMGMLANLYVRPAQDGTPINGYTRFAYNDGDGSTGYDVFFPIQIHSFDPNFHDADETIQPLPFAAMKDVYPMLNGRGYPDTLNAGDLVNKNGNAAQKLDSRITATHGQKILLRVSSLATVDFYTLTVLGLPMKVIGKDARLLRGPDPDGPGPLQGKDLYYDTQSITLGGGESTDVLLDTSGVSPGAYFLYVTNLNNLSNDAEDYGGMMTEITIN